MMGYSCFHAFGGAKPIGLGTSAGLILLLAIVASASIWSASRRISRFDINAILRSEGLCGAYGVPLGFVRALIGQKSGWHRCAVSRKGTVGLMQLMPSTAV